MKTQNNNIEQSCLDFARYPFIKIKEENFACAYGTVSLIVKTLMIM